MLKGCKGKKRSIRALSSWDNRKIFLNSRHSQITIFVIIAIIIVILIASFVYFSNRSPVTTSKDSPQKAIANIISERDKCVEQLTIEGLDYYGLKQDKISTHLNSDFLNCILPIINTYKEQFELSYTIKKLEAVVTNDEIRINLDMPLQVKKDSQIEKTEGKNWINLRTLSANVNSDTNCVLTQDVALVSFDKKFDMHLSKGTKATKTDGTCLKEITLRIEDPETTYGGREKSYTSIIYIPGPIGAQFDKEVTLKQKYSLKDYVDYAKAALASNSYVLPENWIVIQYYNPLNKNYYIYPSQTISESNYYDNKKEITAKVNQFYDGNLFIDDSCKILKTTLVESPDRRVIIALKEGIIARDKNNECVNKIEIKEGKKTSNVVNFGDRDYGLMPGGAQFSSSIIYTYRYTQKQIQNPLFIYGAQNWQNIMSNNWSSPVEDYAPYMTINSPEQNSTVISGMVDFNFRATDDKTRLLNCSLFINYIKQNLSLVIISGSNSRISASLDKEGPYNYFIQCSDGLNVGETEITEIEVINSSSSPLTGFAIREFNNLKYAVSNKITGKVIFTSQNSSILVKQGNERVPDNLKIAYYDNGVYRPWPTTVDTVNKLIIAEMDKFNGRISANSPATGNVITGLLSWSDIFGGDDDGGINIVAQGCTDSRYGLIGLSKIENSNNCTNQIGASPSIKTNVYTIVNDQACFEKQGALTITPSTSAGDTSGTITYDGGAEVLSTSGTHTISEYTLQEANGAPASSAAFGEVCAFTDLYILTKGIGFSSEQNSKEISAEEYVLKINTSIGWDISNCESKSGCQYEACIQCVEWSVTDPGAIGSGTMSSLERCVDIIEHECGPGVLTLATCLQNTGNYKSSAGIIGYMVGDWWKINPVELANQLSSNGLEYTYVELLSDPYNSITKPEIQLPKFKVYVEAMRLRNITTIVNLVHGKLNDGEGDYICQDAFGEDYFNNILNYVNNTIGPDKVIIEANHEWVGGCQERRNSEINILLNYPTTSEKMFYMSAKDPKHYISVHPDPGQSFASGSLVVMDNGDSLKMTSTVNSDGSVTAVPDKLEAYAKSVIACGSGIVYYGYAQSSIDSGAIQALGRAKAG